MQPLPCLLRLLLLLPLQLLVLLPPALERRRRRRRHPIVVRELPTKAPFLLLLSLIPHAEVLLPVQLTPVVVGQCVLPRVASSSPCQADVAAST